jgi:hypothetical protein
LLDAAFDAGITHFDTAPTYGDGTAEQCLGQFLERRRDEVTVATKYGLVAPQRTPAARVRTSLRTAARPLVRAFPGLRGAAQRAAGQMGGGVSKVAFSDAEAKASLEASLRTLRTDHIDLFLMHGAAADDLSDRGLLGFLREAQTQNQIGSFGVGTEWEKVGAIAARCPEFSRVLQFEWLPAGGPAATESFRILHGAIAQGSAAFRHVTEHDEQRVKEWSDETDRDLSRPDVLSALLLRAALDDKPDSVVLFYSRHPERVLANAAVVDDDSLKAPAKRLLELLRQHSGGQAS